MAKQMPNNLTVPELDALVTNFPCEDAPLPAPKKWLRVDVGTLEVYVGDDVYVVALVERLPKAMEEIETNGQSAETVVMRYLQGEGFVADEYIYIGLQRFDLQNPPVE